MTQITIGELNKIVLVALKEQLARNEKLKGRTICLFSLVDDDRGKYIGMLMDKKTCFAPRFMIPREHSAFYGKEIMSRIIKGLLEALVTAIATAKPNQQPFNWKKDPIKARGRTCILDGEITVGESTRLELYSWSKLELC